MKILQRNLNRGTFVVLEMKRNDVVTFLTQWGKSASNFGCNMLISGKIIKEMPGSVASGTQCIYIFYILIFDCSKNQYTYICFGCLLIPISKLCKPVVSNNCMLHALCVAVTVILFGFSSLSGSSFSFLYFQSHVWTHSNFASVQSLPTLLSMGNHAAYHVRKQAWWIKIGWFRNEQLTV
jgi:hypothetical protein